MATPNLAGLLAKPPRPARPAPPPIDDTESAGPTREAPTPPPRQKPSADVDRPLDPEPGSETPPAHEPSAGTAASAVNAKKSRRKAEPEVEPNRPETPGPAQRQYLQTKAFNLPRSLHRRLGEQAAAQHTTRTALILTALNQTHGELATLLVAQDTGTSDGADLFDIPQIRREREPSVQTTIRVTDNQLEAIDGLVSKLGTNRSHLVAAALTIYLP